MYDVGNRTVIVPYTGFDLKEKNLTAKMNTDW